eukprot:Partr_v1_DN27433_c0_g1_i1_m71589 putative Ankyrin Repeat
MSDWVIGLVLLLPWFLPFSLLLDLFFLFSWLALNIIMSVVNHIISQPDLLRYTARFLGITEYRNLMLVSSKSVSQLYSQRELVMRWHLKYQKASFFVAYMRGASLEILNLLRNRNGVDMHYCRSKCLSDAARNNNPAIVKLILAHPPPLHELLVPLTEAAYYGNVDIIEIFISMVPSIRQNLIHCLVAAICNADFKLVQLLLAEGDSFNPETVMCTAAKSGNVEMIRMLFDSCHDFSSAVDSAFVAASKYGNIEAMRLFLDEHEADVHTANDEAFYFASSRCSVDTLRVLLEYGADLRAMEDRALHAACAHNSASVVRFLLENGADILSMGYRCFRMAAEFGDVATMILLSEYGVDIKMDNEVALSLACRNGNLKMAKFLVAQGIDIHSNNDTALIEAARGGHLDTVQFLVQQGADVAADNFAALTSARAEGNFEVTAYLRKCIQ